MIRVSLKTVSVLLLGVLVAPVAAQIPDEFTNLKIFPETIGKRELMTAMRGFSGALGVRCTHCHPGPTPGSLEGVDFATDQLEPKKVAREMMKMTQEINAKLLPATGRPTLTRVQCVTCHRGITDPETLDAALGATIREQDVDAALGRYNELREEHYGSAAYDFSPGTLNSVAEKLAQEDVQGAITLVRANLVHHPKSAYTHLMLGQLLAQSGDKQAAIQSIQRAIELEPDNRWAKQMLERIQSSE